MTNGFNSEDARKTLEVYGEIEKRVNDTILATQSFVDKPLEDLAEGLSRVATRGGKVSKVFEDVLENMVMSLTENFFQSVLGTGKSSGGKRVGQDGSVFSDLASSVFGGQTPRVDPGVFSAQNVAPVNVNIVNNAAAQASVSERTNARGERELEILIDNMVANSLSQGRQTRSVLQSVFGLNNLLRVR